MSGTAALERVRRARELVATLQSELSSGGVQALMMSPDRLERALAFLEPVSGAPVVEPGEREMLLADLNTFRRDLARILSLLAQAAGFYIGCEASTEQEAGYGPQTELPSPDASRVMVTG
ncbi:MAG: hypothetical protein HUU41_19020 [Bryobacteraceae bacterium]|nr:hypothetical protein [Bryobacterales bacterium]MEB2362076.1 hypothetical protein [Bryobacterales bacterium]NUN03204.1 hypothetical protein [Bryobacteraceae bacterium]